MLKKIFLIALGIFFAGCIIWILWRINEREQDMVVPKEAFIPNNSAIVLNIHSNASLSPKLQKIFALDLARYKKSTVYRTIDTLQKLNLLENNSWVLAFRGEGKKDVRFLYILDRVVSTSRGEVSTFLSHYFAKEVLKEQLYDKFRIYTVTGQEEFYYCIAGGKVLFSDSELYLKNALRQIGQDRDLQPDNLSGYTDVTRYFSETAGVNIFFNTTCFEDLWSLYLSKYIVSSNLDITQWFKWGALDVDIQSNGIGCSGFLYYEGLGASFPSVFKGQQPSDSRMEEVVPSGVGAVSFLNLSDVKAYFTALEKFRSNAGIVEKVRKRKAEFTDWFGEDLEADWQELLQGEFAKGTYSYDPVKKEEEGLLIVYLKSGSLGQALLEKMVSNYAGKVHVNKSSLEQLIVQDKEKKVSYYKLPATDFAGVMWGYIWDGIPARYALIMDNYLILASSESVVRNFVGDYMRRLTIKDADWYGKTRVKMSAKYNWMYLAEVSTMYPFYQDMAVNDLKDYMGKHKERLGAFSSLGLQWINEENMLYQNLFLNMEKMEQPQAQIVWQTKLDAKLTMKPVVVTNHTNGERELFVQDESNTVYLIDDMGLILWKLSIDGQINSEVYQVDYYKNGKLQYLFSTPDKLYLIDRNGGYLPNYPLKFKGFSPMGMSMYDYEGDRNYRVFVPSSDRKIYLYELSGDLIKGWDTPQCDNDPVSKVYHFRVDGKDYIVYADRYRIYILDRKGQERVKVQTVFDLIPETSIYLTEAGAEPVLAFGNASGGLHLVGFKGGVQSLKLDKIKPGGYQFNVADIDGDGKDDFVFTRGEDVCIYDRVGTIQKEINFKGARLGFPYLYRFSGDDARVGMVDQNGSTVSLLQNGDQSKGFPIPGISPFSIAFQNTGSVGFYLYIGNENGNLLKYRFIR